MAENSLYALLCASNRDWPRVYQELVAAQLRAITAGECVVRVAHCANDQRLHRGMHCHLHPELFLQVSGFSLFHSPGASLTLYPGEVCVMPRGVPHAEQVGPYQGQPFHNIVVAISEHKVDVHAAHTEAGTETPSIMSNSSIRRLDHGGRLAGYLEDLAEAALAAGNSTATVLVRGLLMTSLALLQPILAGTARPDRGRHPKVVQVQQYIGRSLAQPCLNVQSAAQWLQCSPDYLSHLFHSETGVRLSAYINQCRIRHSRELLDSTTLNVSEVAWACGYRDAGYFARIFKRLTGQSPRAFRQRPR
jgi:AraC-like DNA-binding protein/mannose-6-phosphate isomerase-like protein (cupin superfamily)